MDALEFGRQRRRMCSSIRCLDCKLFEYGCTVGENHATEEDDARAIKAVEKWAAEHPEKTRQSEFLKMFPDAPLKDGCLQIKPCVIDSKYTFDLLKDRGVSCLKRTCDYCCHKYWLTPLED